MHVKEFDLTCADLYLLNFCKKCKQIYPNSCIPNTNLHFHLKDSFLDFGSHSGVSFLKATTVYLDPTTQTRRE